MDEAELTAAQLGGENVVEHTFMPEDDKVCLVLLLEDNICC